MESMTINLNKNITEQFIENVIDNTNPAHEQELRDRVRNALNE